MQDKSKFFTNEHDTEANICQFALCIVRLLANHWAVSQQEAFDVLAAHNLIDEYLIAHFSVLHTQGDKYLIHDIESILGIQKEYLIRPIRQRPIVAASDNVMSDAKEQYDRNRVGGFVIRQIAKDYDIGLGEAVRFYIVHPDIEYHVNTDEYEKVTLDCSYPSKLLRSLSL